MNLSDFVAALGTLALDHRFKRRSLRLLADAEAIYEQAGLDFKPRWTSTYRLLDRDGWLAVGEIATQLHLTHPAVIQLTAEMRAAPAGPQPPGDRHARRARGHLVARLDGSWVEGGSSVPMRLERRPAR